MRAFIIIQMLIFVVVKSFAVEIKIDRYELDHLQVIHYIDDRVPIFDSILYIPQGEGAPYSDIQAVLALRAISSASAGLLGEHYFKVFPEYSYFYFGGLSVDFSKLVQNYCELLSSKMPLERVPLHDLSIVQEKNLTSSQNVAEELLRDISFSKDWRKKDQMRPSPDVKDIHQSLLHFDKLKKTLFIYGPRQLRPSIQIGDCKWRQGAELPRLSFWEKSVKQTPQYIYIIDDQAKQLYWTFGNSIGPKDLPSQDQASFFNEIIGHPQLGLMSRKLRLDLGLVYDFETYFSVFSNYGRVGFRVSTSTKNGIKFIKNLKNEFSHFGPHSLTKKQAMRISTFIKGHRQIMLNAGENFLRQQVYLWHLQVNKKSSKSFQYPWSEYYRLRDWSGVIVGPSSLFPLLSKELPLKSMTLVEARQFLSY